MNDKKSYLMIISGLLAAGLTVGAQAQDGFSEALSKAVAIHFRIQIDFGHTHLNMEQPGTTQCREHLMCREQL